MRTSLFWASMFFVITVVFGVPSALRAGEVETGTGITEITDDVIKSIDKGCEWLAKNQGSDGSWGTEGRGGQYKMVMTGLAGMALLSAGHQPGRGPYGSNLSRAAEFCIKHARNDGLLTSDTEGHLMYGHGFSMTFLAELYGMDQTSELGLRIKDVLAKGVEKTRQSISVNGGWYYSPDSGSDEGSVTVTQVEALRACQNAGIRVPEKMMADSVNYLVKCQNADGGIRYSIQSGQTSSVALTAAGVTCFLMAGHYNDDHAKKAIDFLKKNLDPKATVGYHDYYTNFYGAQAMFQIGGESWAKYYPGIRERLLKEQGSDGSWPGSDVGTTYRTAISTLILSMPYRYLPIFQR